MVGFVVRGEAKKGKEVGRDWAYRNMYDDVDRMGIEN